ncbi:MAG: SemiSWEET family sugar transporter [Sphingomonadales bacterium]
MQLSGVDILGYVAGLITAFTFLPQVIKTWQTKSAKDVSLAMFLIALTNQILWLAFGLLRNDPVIIITNALMLLMTSLMIALKLKYNHS